MWPTKKLRRMNENLIIISRDWYDDPVLPYLFMVDLCYTCKHYVTHASIVFSSTNKIIVASCCKSVVCFFVPMAATYSNHLC